MAEGGGVTYVGCVCGIGWRGDIRRVEVWHKVEVWHRVEG